MSHLKFIVVPIGSKGRSPQARDHIVELHNASASFISQSAAWLLMTSNATVYHEHCEDNTADTVDTVQRTPSSYE